MYLAHGPLSYVLNEKIQKEDISKLSKGEHIAIVLLSIFFGILPDFDLFLLSMVGIPSFLHHNVLTHSIIFWIAIWLILRIGIYIFKKISNKETNSILSNTFLSVLHKAFIIGVMSHLFADILFSYSQILFPLPMEVTILGGWFDKNYFSGSLFTVSTVVEVFIILLFILYIYRSFVKKSRVFEYAVYVCMSLVACLLILSTYISLNTYNYSRYVENGKIQYDADYDTLIDYQDTDTNNDGIDNIQSVDRGTFAKDVQSILEGNYLTSSSENIFSRIVYKYGGLTSYRLISQAFFNQNLPIEPVLTDFAKKEYNIRGYSIEYGYWDLLYTYFKENNLLKDFNVNVEAGSIFFVLDKNEGVVNQGVVLDNNRVGIILKEDRRTKIHTLQEIYDKYSGYTFKVQE